MVHQIGVKLRGQIQDFSGKLCSVKGKVVGRFVEEMLYGIQARGSVRLSEIARSLVQKASVKKRIDRLSRDLGRKGLGSEMSAGILAEGTGRYCLTRSNPWESPRQNQRLTIVLVGSPVFKGALTPSPSIPVGEDLRRCMS